MVSPKTSRAASRRPVPLVSGFSIRPITLDHSSCASLASPSEGSPLVSQLFGNIWSHDRKLMALACFHDEQPATTRAGFAGNRVIEVSVLDALNEQIFDQIKSGPHRAGIVLRCGKRNIPF